MFRLRQYKTIHWKVVAYHGRDRSWRVLPETPGTLVFFDASHQVVARAPITTNAYGSASGDLKIPPGRRLGSWSLQMERANGYARVQVEEYKRPTFEVSLPDAKEGLRLNRPADLVGEARYYFGQPVTRGEAKWRVSRRPSYPWWWGYRYGFGNSNTSTIASGTAALDERGEFHMKFTPATDERAANDKALTYSYEVSVDVTDAGETRSTSRSYRLGVASIEARIEASAGFFVEGEPATLTVARNNLDGAPRPGRGSWRVLSLKGPDHALLPSDQPQPIHAKDNASHAIVTEGDRLRPRWDPGITWEAALAGWDDGEERAHGDLAHDSEGKATLTLPSTLPPGAYRVRYTTIDDFGVTCTSWYDVIIAARTGGKTPLPLAAVLLSEKSSVPVGGTARFFALSGLPDQLVFFDIFREGVLHERRRITSSSSGLIEIPIGEHERGGIAVRISVWRDHQHISASQSVFVPWNDKQIDVSFSTFRDLLRPGAKETWRVTLKSVGPRSAKVETAAQELLAYMYDRSLDALAQQQLPRMPSLTQPRRYALELRVNLGLQQALWLTYGPWFETPRSDWLRDDRLSSGGVVGGTMGGVSDEVISDEVTKMIPSVQGGFSTYESVLRLTPGASGDDGGATYGGATIRETQASMTRPSAVTAAAASPPPRLRSDFSETAFWEPHLITDSNGTASIEFTVPDSVTEWNVWALAVTKDLLPASVHKTVKTVKDLLVRPYLPRFLREGDRAEVKVVVTNASKRTLEGMLTFDIVDPTTNASLLAEFGVTDHGKPFRVEAGGETAIAFSVTTPRRVGLVAFKVSGTAGDMSDGELRPLPVLPSRVHLMQSRFAALQGNSKRTLTFADLARSDDPSRESEQLTVTLDAQLFYSTLQALPYLIDYPYESSESTLNRFLSSAILTSLFTQYPGIAKMASALTAKRNTRLATWDVADPNRTMSLEESPWIVEAQGESDAGLPLVKVLDPRIAEATRDDALARLARPSVVAAGRGSPKGRRRRTSRCTSSPASRRPPSSASRSITRWSVAAGATSRGTSAASMSRAWTRMKRTGGG